MLQTAGRPWASSRWAVIKDARRRQQRRQRRVLATVAVLLTAAAVGWVTAANSWPHHPSAPPPTGLGTVEQLHLGGVVQDTTTLGANVWVLTCLRGCAHASSVPSAGELIELTATGRPIRRVPVSDPTALAGGAGAIWIAHFRTGQVTRVDPRTDRTTATTDLQLPKGFATPRWTRFQPSGIDFGGGQVWVSSAFGYLAQLNARTARLQRTVFTSSEVTSATTAGGLTWVADELDGVGTYTVGSHHVGIHPISWAREPVDVQTVAHGAGMVWAFGTETSYLTSLTDPTTAGVVTTLDPLTGRIMNQWRVPPDATTLVLGNDGGYVGDDRHGQLLRLTPPHGVETLHAPAGAKLSAATPNALWAINHDGQLLRISLRSR